MASPIVTTHFETSLPKTQWILNEKCYVSASLIHGAGNGLFAKEPIHKNQVITWMEGRLLSRDEARALPDTSYCFSLNFFEVLDGLRTPQIQRGGASFANHSFDCKKRNAKFVVRFDKATHRNDVLLKATRDIASDEEILVNYGRGYWARRELLT